MHLAILLVSAVITAAPDKPIDIGSRRELLVDHHLIDSMKGVRLELHHPTPQQVVFKHDTPWEGSGSGYHSIFRDGDRYRMYYKAWQLSPRQGKVVQPHPLFACYAQSKDGIHWQRPNLGLVEFEGSTKNNIILAPGKLGGVDVDPGHVAVFKDDNPKARPQAKYKAIFRSRKPRGLLAFGSPDGIHWSPLADRPVITKGAFDSQNLAFWDSVRKEYRAYVRDFREGRRGIRTTTSPDFLNWTDPEWLTYPGAPNDQLYTNQIKPYHRAPHMLIGFPTRYVERGWSESMRALPELEHRKLRSSASDRYGMVITEGLLMTSRDGQSFHRWPEAFLRPGPERPGTWAYGNKYIAWHVVETPSALPGAPNELSIYASENYWTGKSSHLRRYTLRLDGFVSASAPHSGGELVTKPLVFDGQHLKLNFSTSAAGSIRVELQDASGQPIKGFSLADCQEIFGDAIDRTVHWKAGDQVVALAGKAIRMRFVLKDANLYAFRFSK